MIREIRKSRDLGSEQAARLLAALFAVELSKPSKCLWIVSPWISDVPILDNTAEGFDALSSWGSRRVTLAEVLVTLAERGTHVVVVTTTAETNRWFRSKLEELFKVRCLQDRLTLVIDEEELLHTKSIVADDYVVSGSMNITMRGIMLRDEFVQVQYATEQVSAARMDALDRFGGVA